MSTEPPMPDQQRLRSAALAHLARMSQLISAVENRALVRLGAALLAWELAAGTLINAAPIARSAPVLVLALVALMIHSKYCPNWVYRVGLIGAPGYAARIAKGVSVLPAANPWIESLKKRLRSGPSILPYVAEAGEVVHLMREGVLVAQLMDRQNLQGQLSHLCEIDLSEIPEGEDQMTVDQIVGRLAYVWMVWRLQQVGAIALAGALILISYVGTLGPDWGWQGYPLVLGLMMGAVIFIGRAPLYTPRLELVLGFNAMAHHRYHDYEVFVERAAAHLMELSPKNLWRLMSVLLMDRKEPVKD